MQVLSNCFLCDFTAIYAIKRGVARLGPPGAYPGDILARARALETGVAKRVERGLREIRNLSTKWLRNYNKAQI